MEITDIDKAYAAGFFDGEGHVQLSRNNNGSYYAKTTVAQRLPQALSKFQSIWGGGVYLSNGCHYWKLQKQVDVIAFLVDIQPYLIVKQAEVDLILACKGIYIEADSVALKALRIGGK